MPTTVATQVTPIAMRSTRAVVAEVVAITIGYLEPLLFCVVAAGAGACTDGVPAIAAVAPGTGTYTTCGAGAVTPASTVFFSEVLTTLLLEATGCRAETF